jgi:hypothetical protein
MTTNGASINAIISKDGLVDVFTTNHGMNIKKTISIADFIKVLNSNDDGDKESIVLPYGTVKFFESGQRFTVIIKIHEHVRSDSSFSGSSSHSLKFDSLPVPNGYMIVLFSKISQRVYKTHFIAEQPFNGPLDIEAKKYMSWPFNNYSPGYGGGVCWGNNSPISQIKDISQLDRLIDIYFQSPFNGDLDGVFDESWVNEYLKKAGIEREGDASVYIAVNSFFKENGSFPYQILQPLNVSLKTLITGS